MTPNQTRSGLFETPRNKPAAPVPTTPRPSKLSRGPLRPDLGSQSPLLSPARFSVDQSPRSVSSGDRSPRSVTSINRSPPPPGSFDARPSIDRRPTKTNRIPDRLGRPSTASGRSSELRTELDSANEELKKAKERLTALLKEKDKALDDLKEAHRQADEASNKLAEAIAAQKQAEESVEIEKFRAVELEQAGIDAAQKREEAWQKELENVRNQHALDVSALLSTTQELKRVKHELVMTTEAKNTATSHADDALKIAEISAEKVAVLSAEVSRLKTLLDSKLESKDKETGDLIKRLQDEIETVQSELRIAKDTEKKLIEAKALVEALKIEVTDAKKAEINAQALVEEWQKKAELLEEKVEQAAQSERLASESLASALKQLKDTEASLQDAESEISCFKGKIESLEMEITRYQGDIEESNAHLELTKKQATEMEKLIEVLKSQVQTTGEEKMKALDNGEKMTSCLPSLLDEKQHLVSELEKARSELDQTKKAMESLASALNEVSSEARESQEKLLMTQTEVANATSEIERLKLASKQTEEKYESMLIGARDEVAHLKIALRGSEAESTSAKSEMDSKENDYIMSLKKSEEDIASTKAEICNLHNDIKTKEAETAAAKEEGTQLLSRLNQIKLEASSANQALDEARAESLQMKDRLLDKENELQSISQENEELRGREEAALQKINELSMMLEEAAKSKKVKDTTGQLSKSNSEKDYDIVSKGTEFSDDAPGDYETKHTLEIPVEHHDEDLPSQETRLNDINGNGNIEYGESDDKAKNDEFKASDDVSSPKRVHEPEAVVNGATEFKLDSNPEPRKELPIENVATGDTAVTHQKKKSPFHKFGSLLKKKNTKK